MKLLTRLTVLFYGLKIILTQFNYPYTCLYFNSTENVGSTNCSTGHYLAGSLSAATTYRVAPCQTCPSLSFYFTTNTNDTTISCRNTANETYTLVCSISPTAAAEADTEIEYCNITIPKTQPGIYYKLYQICE